MNYFFKFLLPQLLDYFKEETLVKEFLPKILLEYTDNFEREEKENETTNK